LNYNPEKQGKKPTQSEKSIGKSIPDRYSCSAIGEDPAMVLAVETDLHVMGFYSPRDKRVINVGNSNKIRAISFYNTKNSTYFYMIDHVKNQIMMVTLGNDDLLVKRAKRSLENEHSDPVLIRKRRQADAVNVTIPLKEPKALAIDWVTERLYVIDNKYKPSIVVMTLHGRKKTTLIKLSWTALEIAVDPTSGWLAYSKHGKIEASSLDGLAKKALVDDEVVWPVGLAFDPPSSRLFFADSKRRVVESIGINGERRWIVAQLDRTGPMPYKLDVFEDTVLVTMFQSNIVVRLNKFVQKLPTPVKYTMNTQVSDVIVVHSVKQKYGPVNPCKEHSCHDSALCVMKQVENNIASFTCVCPDGLTAIDPEPQNTSRIICEFVPTPCLACFHGYCNNNGSEPRCICHPGFTGPLCNRYICSDYCRNGGTCSLKNNATPVCHCTGAFTGERCEIDNTPSCPNNCLNNGTCISGVCVCQPGYTGVKCQNCVDLYCHNGASCSISLGKEECFCESGFRGQQCEYSVCDNYCTSGKCVVADGAPKCECPPGKTGSKCDKDVCQGYCENGGTCSFVRNNTVCTCPPTRTGPRCSEIRLCNGRTCMNGGVCDFSGMTPLCVCQEGWRGPFCDEAHTCQSYCFNGGSCSMNNFNPRCLCPTGYFGVRCEVAQVEIAENSQVSDFSVTAGVLIAISIVLFLIVSAGVAYFVIARIRRGNSFGHVRMSENVEVNNPMYLQGEEIDENDDLSVSVAGGDRNNSNFTNPVYETVYNSGEEKKNLLSCAIDDTLPLDNDTI